jgi:uncharacterized protein YaiL (DUF2058 family)
MDWLQAGSSSRVPAQQAQSSEFKFQSHQKKIKKIIVYSFSQAKLSHEEFPLATLVNQDEIYWYVSMYFIVSYTKTAHWQIE